MILKNKNDLEQVRQAARKEMEAFDCRILVCSGTGCVASGAEKIYQTFQEIVKDAPGVTLEFAPHDENEHVGIKKTGCQGFCELGPLVRSQKGDNVIQYIKVQPDDCADIFDKSVRHDEVIEELLYKQKEKVYRHPDEIPFIAKQTRVVLENCGKYDAVSLNEYIASGGFSAFARALFEMKPEDVVEEIDKSGLRGRGGGGFPTGRKGKQVALCATEMRETRVRLWMAL